MELVIAEEDRIYPMPQTHWTQKMLPDQAREFDVAVRLGALRLPKSGFLVIPVDLAARNKSELRKKFGGAAAKRRREAAMEELRSDTVERLQGRAVGGGGADGVLLFAHGDGEFSKERLLALAKEDGVDLKFDHSARYHVGRGDLSMALMEWASDEAKAGWSADQAAWKLAADLRGAEVVAAAEAAVAARARKDIAFRLPEPGSREFSEGVEMLGDMKRGDLLERIRQTADVVVAGGASADVLRAFRVMVSLDSGGDSVEVSDYLKGNVAALDRALGISGVVSSRELLAIKEAFDGDGEFVKRVDPLEEARRRSASVLRMMEVAQYGMGSREEFAGMDGFQIIGGRGR